MKSKVGLLFQKLFVGVLGVLIYSHASAVCGAADLLGSGEDTGKYNDVVVQEVLRADTLRLESGETVQLIGVRAFGSPARKKKISRDEYGFVVKEKVDLEVPVAQQAQEFLMELLEGKHVRLEFDAARKDDEYKTLAYVFLIDGDVFVNAQVLEHGFADLRIQPPNLKYAQRLRDAYREGSAYAHGMDE